MLQDGIDYREPITVKVSTEALRALTQVVGELQGMHKKTERKGIVDRILKVAAADEEIVRRVASMLPDK